MAQGNPFTAITPEEAGVPSRAVSAFIKKLAEDKLCMHGFIMLKGGRIFAEGYWGPYGPEDKHRVYSISKSFTSVAVGLLMGEGRLSLADKVVDFFPERVAPGISPYLARTTIRDLLMMADSHDSTTYTHSDPDWIATYFDKPSSHIPGAVFSYNTSCSVMLTAIVERVTGKKLLDYMRPLLLGPIGVSDDIYCIETPCGHSWGGSGVLCTPRDLARLALVCMNHGRCEGRQLIPEGYIDAATSRQIDNCVDSGNPEFQFGYGYQIWRTRNNGFAFRGMGTQLAICLPDKDFVLVTTGDTQGYVSGDVCVYKALWEEIYPHLDGRPLGPDNEAYGELIGLVKGLHFPLPEGAEDSMTAARISGMRYRMTDNAMGISDAEFAFSAGAGEFLFSNALGAQRIAFGFGRYQEQTFSQTNYFGRRIGTPSGKGYRAFASAAWADARTLVIQAYLADDYCGNMKILAHFDGNEVTLHMMKAAEWFLGEYSGFASGKAD